MNDRLDKGKPETTLRPFPTCPTKQACYAVRQCQNVCGVVHGAREPNDGFVAPPAGQSQTTDGITKVLNAARSSIVDKPMTASEMMSAIRKDSSTLACRICHVYPCICPDDRIDAIRAQSKTTPHEHIKGGIAYTCYCLNPPTQPQTTDDALIDHIAIAILETWSENHPSDWEDPLVRRNRRIEARAALRAVREWRCAYGEI